MENCRICGHTTELQFKKKILLKYEVGYWLCGSCGFLQTDQPYWLKEAYSSAITSLDIGLLNRNLTMLEHIPKLIDACFPDAKIMLDYAGGYGVFTRMMRDLGYNFYRQDVYCENIFAKHFDIGDQTQTKFDVLTAFEVFEHFENPLAEIEALFKYSDSVIFSTQLLPKTQAEMERWWYISEETGQHISFYSLESLQYLAKKWGKHLFSKYGSIHLFTNAELTADQVDYAFKDIEKRSYFFGLFKTALNFQKHRSSLLERDFQLVRGIVNK